MFGWGTPDLDAQKVIDYLAALFFALKFPARVRGSDDATVRAYTGGTAAAVLPTTKTLNVTFYSITIAGNDVEAGFRLRPLPASGSHLPGFALEPLIPSQFPLKLQLADDIALRLLAGTNVPDLFGLVMRPDGAALVYPFAPGTPPPSAGIGVGFDFTPADPVIVLGETGGTRLQSKGGSIDLSTNFGGAGLEIALHAQLSGLALILSPGEGDGFIREIIGDSETTIAIPLGVQWSNLSGFSFKGSAAFEVSLYPHLQLGPVCVDVATISLTAPSGGPPRISLKVTAGISGALGPVKFVVQGIGLSTDVIFQPGNAGPFGIDLGFKPPDGVGPVDRAEGVVTGGGFLFHDDGAGAVCRGRCSCRCNEHDHPEGVRADRDAHARRQPRLLADHLHHRRGFPARSSWGWASRCKASAAWSRSTAPSTRTCCGRDQERHAGDAAVSARSGGQRAGDHQVVGQRLPGAARQLSAGHPGQDRLVHADAGDAGSGADPGVRRAHAPAGAGADQLDAAFRRQRPGADESRRHGRLDFDAGTIAIDAVLVDSRLVHKFAHDRGGGAARRLGLGWSTSSCCRSAASIRALRRPPACRALARLPIALSTGNNPRMGCDAYFAITANTMQFGARRAAVCRGLWLQRRGRYRLRRADPSAPLHFIADFHASVQLKRGSDNLFKVAVEGELEGPRPLRLSGKASFKIFWCDFSVRFDTTLIEGEPPPLPPAVDVLALLEAALSTPQNWSTRNWRPTRAHGVALRSLPPAAPGWCSIRSGGSPSSSRWYRSTPARDIDIFGGAPVAGTRRFAFIAGAQRRGADRDAAAAGAVRAGAVLRHERR